MKAPQNLLKYTPTTSLNSTGKSCRLRPDTHFISPPPGQGTHSAQNSSTRQPELRVRGRHLQKPGYQGCVEHRQGSQKLRVPRGGGNRRHRGRCWVHRDGTAERGRRFPGGRHRSPSLSPLPPPPSENTRLRGRKLGLNFAFLGLWHFRLAPPGKHVITHGPWRKYGRLRGPGPRGRGHRGETHGRARRGEKGEGAEWQEGETDRLSKWERQRDSLGAGVSRTISGGWGKGRRWPVHACPELDPFISRCWDASRTRCLWWTALRLPGTQGQVPSRPSAVSGLLFPCQAS